MEADASNNERPVRVVVDRPSRAGLAFNAASNAKVTEISSNLKLKESCHI